MRTYNDTCLRRSQVDSLREELAEVREEADRRLAELESSLQEQLRSAQRAEQLEAAAAKEQHHEVAVDPAPLFEL